MEINLAHLTEIVNTASHWTLKDPRVYTPDEEVIILLAQVGGEIQTNCEQKGGKWLTEIKVGNVIFVHSGDKQIVK